MDDFVFTFDTNPFMAAIDQITQGFESLKDTLNNFAGSAQKKTENWVQDSATKIKQTSSQVQKSTQASITNFSDNAKTMIGALTKRVLGLGAAYLSIRKALTYIPEVGRAFRHAGDIALRSFLWPLRRMLIPILNDMLAWVRDHRAMFVRWGTVLANVFKTVYTLVRRVIDVMRSLYDSFFSRFEQIFGKTTNRLSDVMNILMFKFTVLVEYLLAVLTPVAEKIGTLIANIMGIFKRFFKGFTEGMGDISPRLGDIVEQLGRMWDIISDLMQSTGILGKTFETLGRVIGTILHPALALIGQSIDTIAAGIDRLIRMVKLLKAWKDDDKATMASLVMQQKEADKEFNKRMKERWSDTWESMKKGFGGIADVWRTPPEERQPEVPRRPEPREKEVIPRRPELVPERKNVAPRRTEVKETKTIIYKNEREPERRNEIPRKPVEGNNPINPKLTVINTGDKNVAPRTSNPDKPAEKNVAPRVLKLVDSKKETTREVKEKETKENLKTVWVNPPKAPNKITNRNVKVEAKISMGKTEININTEGDAKKVGEELATSMSKTLNKELRKMLQDSNLGVATA